PRGRRPASCRMLVLSPTRELAAQIAQAMRGYARHLDVSVQCIFGGVPAGRQARALERGCDVLVATPGRLLDLVDQRALSLRHVAIFVLDEADQMMDLGFIRPLTRIAALLPERRQSMFFSATMPKAIVDLGKRFIHDPVRVEVTPQATTAERVEQYATFLDHSQKQTLLNLYLRAGLADGSVNRALVFTRTKHGADRVVRHLAAAGVPAAAIHGIKSQSQRTAALASFRQGSCRVLVATDIAARGIDIAGVSHVFNFELPNVPEQYVHRIGRTARAGADGMAISYVAPEERNWLRQIERLTGVRLMARPLPEDFPGKASCLPIPAGRSDQQEIASPGKLSIVRREGRSRARHRQGDAAWQVDGGRRKGVQAAQAAALRKPRQVCPDARPSGTNRSTAIHRPGR
ncbi:MAG: DEAD/DEAH box helicase, partial [Novosphingobium sp.]|nr:DEAD/DEAH box helicase [Novosphingobium sp.]